MILKGKIQNKEQVSKFYKSIYLEENPDTKEDDISASLKNLSCPLCFRFLIVPKQHRSCRQRFCEDCIIKWTRHFPFCPVCKIKLTPNEIENSEIDHKYNTLMRLIKIKCKLGKCLKEDENKVEDNNSMPVIFEREQAEEVSAQEDEEEKNFFLSWFSKKKSKSSINNSDLCSIDHSNLQNSDLINSNRSWSSINNSLDSNSSLLSENKNKRYFSVNDYILHLVRKHSWPLMEIIPDKPANKMTFVGFKKEKYVKSQGLFKLGPGVIHSIKPNKDISSLVGIYLNDELKKNARIYNNFDLIFEGKLVNGFYEQAGILKHLVQIETDSGVCSGSLEFNGHFKRGKFHGKGKLFFIGDYQKFKEYFENKKKAILESNLNVNFFKSNESYSPSEKFFLKYSYFENKKTPKSHFKGNIPFLVLINFQEFETVENELSGNCQRKRRSNSI
jgi:hypothetical protein